MTHTSLSFEPKRDQPRRRGVPWCVDAPLANVSPGGHVASRNLHPDRAAQRRCHHTSSSPAAAARDPGRLSKNLFTYNLSPGNAAATWALLELRRPRWANARGTTHDDGNGTTTIDEHPKPGGPRPLERPQEDRRRDGGAGPGRDGGRDGGPGPPGGRGGPAEGRR